MVSAGAAVCGLDFEVVARVAATTLANGTGLAASLAVAGVDFDFNAFARATRERRSRTANPVAKLARRAVNRRFGVDVVPETDRSGDRRDGAACDRAKQAAA